MAGLKLAVISLGQPSLGLGNAGKGTIDG